MKSLLFLLCAMLPLTNQTQNQITTANIADIQQASKFLTICGSEELTISPSNASAIKSNTSDDPTVLISKAMDASLAEHRMCLAYLTGVIDGWREGHEHGVDSMLFPSGIPDASHYKQALAALSSAQLNAANKAMKADPICLPEQISVGETMNAVVRYIKSQTQSNPFMGLAPTARLVHPALNSTFRCPGEKSSP